MPCLPRVLLLGDSIRMSYQPAVAELLDGKAEVVGPEGNGQYSAFTLEHLDEWIEQLGCPNLVHWNNGIHDVGHNPTREPIQYPLCNYLANLRAILDKLLANDAQVIWATSTPVHPDKPWNPDGWSWRNGEINRYNTAARKLMQQENVPINDLHALVEANVDDLLGQDMLHLSDEGKRLCAEAVTKAAAPYLDT